MLVIIIQLNSVHFIFPTIIEFVMLLKFWVLNTKKQMNKWIKILDKNKFDDEFNIINMKILRFWFCCALFDWVDKNTWFFKRYLNKSAATAGKILLKSGTV